MGAGTRADNKKCFTFQSTNNMAFNGQAKRAKPKQRTTIQPKLEELRDGIHTHVRSSIIVKKNFILKNARTSIKYTHTHTDSDM